MFIEKTRSLLLSAGAVLFTGSVMASDATIHITGSVVEQSCTVQATVQELHLPSIATADVKDSGASGSSSVLRIPVTCAGATAAKGSTVTMALLPAVTDVSSNGTVLLNKASGSKAEGIGVSLLDQSGQLLTFNNGRPATVNGVLNGDSGAVVLAAKYAKDGSSSAVTAGSVEVNVPFVLTYK